MNNKQTNKMVLLHWLDYFCFIFMRHNHIFVFQLCRLQKCQLIFFTKKIQRTTNLIVHFEFYTLFSKRRITMYYRVKLNKIQNHLSTILVIALKGLPLIVIGFILFQGMPLTDCLVQISSGIYAKISLSVFPFFSFNSF